MKFGTMNEEEGPTTIMTISSRRRLFTKRKRTFYPLCSIASIHHAILLLLAFSSSSGSSNSRYHYGKLTTTLVVDALISPSFLPARYNNWMSPQQQRTEKSRTVLSTSLMSAATTATNVTTTQIKGQTTAQIKGQKSSQKKSKAKRERSKKQKESSQKKTSYQSTTNSEKSRIIQRSNRKKSRILQKRSPSEPWNADYSTSLQTQRKIQAAAHNSNNGPSVKVAHAVLQTLLNAPPTECNAANVVCALTLSSKKLLGSKQQQRNRGGHSIDDESSQASFQTSLLKTLQILTTLVTQSKLIPRQLCNAAWSIAKHVEYNPALYTRWNTDKNYVLVGDSKSSWDLTLTMIDDKNERSSSEELIDELLNLIALRVVEHLEETRRDYGVKGSNNKRRVQPGELSMLLWAYAVAKPRDCPPGWEQPRRMERLSNADEKEKKSATEKNGEEEDDLDIVTFVELDDGYGSSSKSSSFGSSNNAQSSTKPLPYESITSKLFDAAAIAFCQGEGSAVKKQYTVSNNIKKISSEEEQTTLLKNCTWSELSNIAWSYATRGAYASKESEAMMAFFAKEATRRIRYCKHHTNKEDGAVCNILPRDVIQIAWALGMMESDNVSVGDALVHLVDAINDYWIDNTSRGEDSRPLAKWTCADLVQMATALAHGRLDNQSVLMAVYEESLVRLRTSRSKKPQRKKGGFSTPEISILMWVQARLYLTPKFGVVYGEFPSVASRALLERMEEVGNNDKNQDEVDGDGDHNHHLFPATIMHRQGLGPQEQANLAWSLTILENYNTNVIKLLQSIFHAASSSNNNDDEGGGNIIQLEHAHQLWQSYFLLSKDCPPAVQYVPPKFSAYLEEKWNIEKSRSKQSSSRHRSISQTLNLMRVAHRNEYDEDVDVAIVLEEDSAWTHMAHLDYNFDSNNVRKQWKKVAVEFDGPHHFTVMASTGHDLRLMESGTVKMMPRVLGHTMLKYRLLKKKGWTVVRIPYYEFDKIPFWASMERQRYLQRALKTHDKIEFSVVDVSEYSTMPPTRHSRFD